MIFFLLNIILASDSLGQKIEYSNKQILGKSPIDMTILRRWPHVNAPVISPNGAYVSYTINEQPENSRTLVVCGVNVSWEKKVVGGSDGFFSKDNRLFVFRHVDTLCFLELGTNIVNQIPNIQSMKFSNDSAVCWLGYCLKNSPHELIVRNILTGIEKNFSNVSSFVFSSSGSTLLLTSSVSNALDWVDLPKGDIKRIWPDDGVRINNYVFDRSGSQIVMMVTNPIPEGENSIWYYRAGMDSAIKLADDHSPGVDSGFVIGLSAPYFTKNGKYVLFSEKRTSKSQRPDPGAAMVDVWHYKDVRLNSEQQNDPTFEDVTCAIRTQGGPVVRIEKDGWKMVISPTFYNGDFTVVSNMGDFFWWDARQKESYYVVSFADGSRKLLRSGRIEELTVSSTGAYVLYFDGKERNYYIYDTKVNLSRNLTNTIPRRLDNEYELTFSGKYPDGVGIGAWLKNDTSVLIYDNYDIWQVDPSGKHTPIDLTNGYGFRQHIKFRLVNFSNDGESLTEGAPLLLTAFNVKNKYNGFYQVLPIKNNDPEKLCMGPYLLYRVDSQSPNGDDFDKGMIPVKASDANVWIIKKQTSTEAPNYFVTFDFRNFRPISDIQPQLKYNWLTTELVTYKQMDGSFSQGILYKPEDFDPKKKYPLIFSYYETFSHRMYEYPVPGLNHGRIDIPSYVSRGYLVFTPDIHYSVASVTGQLVGDAAVNSVVGAAKYLMRRPYIDSTKMGIQGHSFAGGETLYIITHSKLFAAACAASSTTSDEVSAYLSLLSSHGRPVGEFRQAHAEGGHDRIGVTLWEKPQLYINASPVFKANEVTTPLLIMHNRGDESCNWEQGLEMYIALRRLGKKVWMLQYDGQDHTVNGEAATDFTIRVDQFFDYYMKGKFPPKWMTVGVPARLKGIDTGLEVDSSGAKP
ncbi:prolyl oligopeptidase family protein [Dinghuibacter silviterrae]|uniref:Prolyl oligopeptidase family protein n=1 Tax=Dinghuibacter silviterrae TaxID=1539049 RepID=A0A4R8DXB0_9BACT|nr:prolyl oligopeptidase family protein [Dinghuibacter silviterrae]